MPVEDYDDFPVEEAYGRRYSLRTRQARQLNPYQYDKALYKQQLKSNPEAIVSVLSPTRRRRGSPKQHESERGSGSEAEVEPAEEEDREEERFWRRLEKRRAVDVERDDGGNGKNRSKESVHGQAGARVSSVEPPRPELDDSYPSFLNDTFSSPDDDDDLILPNHTKRSSPKIKSRKKRLKPFPMKRKDLLELHARYGADVRLNFGMRGSFRLL